MQKRIGAGLANRLLAGSLALFLTVACLPARAQSAADLSSTTRNNVATSGGAIKVGGAVRSINPGDLLTDAEHLALTQVTANGKQLLLLNSLGAAIGGRFDVSSVGGLSGTLSELVIPAKVTGLQNIHDVNGMNITGGGSLTNSGSYYFYSTNGASAIANVNAQNILNNATGLISSITPQALIGAALTQIPSVDLNLTAIGSLTNHGTISSSGSLGLTAGTTLTNSKSVLVSALNKNLTVTSNSITNSGLMQVLKGNLLITAPTGDISVNNTNGTLQALKTDTQTATAGANITVREVGFADAANFVLTGGKVLANSMTVHSGTGGVGINVGEFTPALAINAGSAYVVASTKDLKIGTLTLTAAPTIRNLTGNVLLGSNMVYAGQPIAVVANGNILVDKDNLVINTSSTTGDGGAVTLVAGANFTLSGGGGIVAPDTLITGASKTGGKIDLNLSATKDLQTFDTGSTFADGNAGDVRMIAFKGTGVESGRVVTVITTNGPTISAIGGAAGTNGDILVIGGSTSKGAFALQLGAFNTGSLGTATGGNIELYNAVPKVTTGGVSIVNGAITGGSFDDGALVNGSLIMTNGLLATNAGGFFIAKSAGNVSLTNLNSVGDVTVHAGAPVISGTSAFAGLVVNDISSGGKIELKTTANNTGISLNGNINAQQDVLIEAHGGGGIFGLARTTTIFSNFGAGNVATFLLGVTVNKEGTKLYVPDFARDSTAEAGSHGFPNVAHHTGKVYVLDAATGASLGTITLGEGTHPQGTALSPDGSKLYVTYGRSNRFAIIDTATNSLIGSPITFGVSTEKAEAVAVAPNGNVYVLSNNGSSNAAQKITIFDANGVQIGVIDSASTGGVFNGTGNSQTGGIVINPVGTVMYVSSAGNKKVFAFDLQTNQVIGNPIDFSYYNAVAPQLTPYALAMDPNGTRVYVGIAGLYREFDGLGNLVKQEVRPGHIAVIDSTNFSSNFNKVLANVMLPTAVSQGGSFPQGLAVNATGTELLVQSTYLNGVSSMYTAPNQVLQFIETSTQSAQGNGPDGFGSSAFSSVVHLGEIPVMRTFSSNTQNLAVNPVGSKNPIPNNISVIQKGTVLGDNVTLKSGGGNIILNYAVRNGGTMTVNTTGGGAVLLSNLSDGANNVGASAAPGNFFEIGSTHGMTITGDIKSPRIILRSSSTADDIVLNANIGQTGAIIDIMANGNANIIQGAGTLITGTTARLFTGTGNIIGASGALETKVSNLSAITNGTGDVHINNVGALILNGSGAGNSFTLSNTGAITVATGGGIMAPNVDLSTNVGSNGSITLNAQVGVSRLAGNLISINTDGSGAVKQGKGTFRVIGDQVQLNSDKGSFGASSAALRVDTNSLGVFSDGGSGYFDAAGDIALGAMQLAKGTLSVTAAGDIITNGIQSGKTVTLKAGDDITINSNIGQAEVGTFKGGVVTLDAGGDILRTSPTALVNGATVTFKAGGAQIGSAIDRINTTARTITVTAPSASVFLGALASDDALLPYAGTLKASTAGATFDMLVDGKITTAGALLGNDITIQTFNNGLSFTGGSRDIVIGGNIGRATAGGSTTLTASNNGVGTPGSTANIIKKSGMILSPEVFLNIGQASDIGNIGTAAAPIATKSAFISASAPNASAGGSVFIANTGDVELVSASAPGGMFSLTATKKPEQVGDTGRITVSGTLTGLKDITLQTKTNGNIVLAGGSIQATGNIVLSANGSGQIMETLAASPLTAGGTLTLLSGKGAIGSGSARILVNGGTVAVKTGGNAFLNFTDDGTLATSTVGGSSGTFSVTSDAGADVTLGGIVTAPTVNISLNGNLIGSIDPKHFIAGKTTNLETTTGNIGTAGTRVLTKATTLTVNASNDNASAFVRNTGTATLGAGAIVDTLSGNGVLDLLNDGALKIGGNVSADAMTIGTTGGAMTSGGNFTLAAADSLVLRSTDKADTGTVVTAANIGTPTAKLQVDTPNFTANTKGKVYVDNAYMGTNTLNAFEGALLNYSGGLDTQVSGPINSPSVTISSGQDVIISANVGTTAGTTKLFAGQNIYATGTVIGKNVTLDAASGIGDPGGAAVDAANLTLHFTTNAIINDTVAGPMTVVAQQLSSTPISLQITNNGNLTIKGSLEANSISLNAGTGAITTATGVTLDTDTLSLTSVGNQGGPTTPINTSGVQNLTVNSSNGLVNILNSGGSVLDIGASTGRRGLQVVTNTGVTISGPITTGNGTSAANGETTNNLRIIGNGSNFNVNADVTANGGSVLLQNTNLSGDINVGSLVQIEAETAMGTSATTGTVTIVIGAVPTTPTIPLASGTGTPGFIVSNANGGQVFGGPVLPIGQTGGFETALLAGGSNVVFNNQGSGSIEFGDNASVSAFKAVAMISGAVTVADLTDTALVAPTEDIDYKTIAGDLHIEAGSAVLAVAQKNGVVSVYNLHDNGTGDVTFTIGKNVITVAPGSHVTIAPGLYSDFSEVNSIECIGHRGVTNTQHGEFTVFQSDFSVASALKGLRTLSELRTASQPAQRRMHNNIVKTAAVLMQLQAKNGAYQRYRTAKSRVTAMQ